MAPSDSPRPGTAGRRGRASRLRGARDRPSRPLARRIEPRFPDRGFAVGRRRATRRRGRPADPVAETFAVRPCGDGREDDRSATAVHVLPKPGVTDPEAESARAILRDLGFAVENVRTIHTYRIEGPAESLPRLVARVLANDAVEQAVVGPLPFDRLGQGAAYHVRRVEVPVLGMDDD
ncbi:MAG: phosphoribosylformylglycinamidine synthase subunit PurS, partial [Singulisphaera sp.]